MALDEEATMFVGDDETVYVGESSSTDPGLATMLVEGETDDVSPVAAGSDGSTSTEAGERTNYASEAQELGVLFRHRFRMQTYGLAPKRRLQLAGAVGVSTQEGQQARQYIVLVKEVNEKHGAMVIGWLDSAGGRAQLRSYQRIAQQHHGRFKKPFDMTEDAYKRMLQALTSFMEAHGLQVDLSGPNSSSGSAVSDGIRPMSMKLVLFAGLGILLLGVLIGLALQ